MLGARCQGLFPLSVFSVHSVVSVVSVFAVPSFLSFLSVLSVPSVPSKLSVRFEASEFSMLRSGKEEALCRTNGQRTAREGTEQRVIRLIPPAVSE